MENSKEISMTFKKFLGKMFGAYRPFLGAVIALFAILLLKEALNLVGPYIYGKIIDGIISKKAISDVLFLLGIAVAVAAFNGFILSYIRERMELKRLDFEVGRFLSKMTLQKMLDFSIGQHDNQNSGIKKSVIDKGEHSLTALASSLMYDVLPSSLHIIVAATALTFLAPILGLVVWAGAILFLISSIYLNYAFRDDIKKWEDMGHDLNKKHGEILRNATLVKLNAKESEMVREYDLDRKIANDFAKKLWLRFIIWAEARGLLPLIARFTVMGLGIYFVYQNVYTPGSLVIFLMWSNNAFGDLYRLANIHRRIMEMYVAVKNYFILLDVEPDIKEIENPIILKSFRGEIKYENVYFKYPKREYIGKSEKRIERRQNESRKRQGKEYVLENINLQIGIGQKAAIVGPSGTGKSTMIQLLVRAYDPDKGDILIDGNKLKDLKLDNFRSAIGMVPQDIALFDNSLKYNILFGLREGESVSEDYLWEIAKMASLDKFVSKLENGFDTIVGERGVKLSGGERQRVGIARALIKNPSILIFDEATSSLDTENEALIHESIEKASHGRTTIIIAHRLSTVKDANKIIVMENGKVVGEGRHEDLLKSCETYQRLINNQTIMVGGA